MSELNKIGVEFEYCKFKNNCDKNAICIYNSIKQSYDCRCLNGFIGNGFKCYGNYSFYHLLLLGIF